MTSKTTICVWPSCPCTAEGQCKGTGPRAALSAAPVGVRVRELEWEPMKRDKAIWTATCPVSGHMYRAFDEDDKREQDARRIARIMAALTPAPADDVRRAALMEAAVSALRTLLIAADAGSYADYFNAIEEGHAILALIEKDTK